MAVALVLMSGCGNPPSASGEPPLAVAAPLVSAVGELGPQRGLWQVDVSPRDVNDLFVGEALLPEYFGFANVTLALEGDTGSPRTVEASVSAVEVLPAENGELTALLLFDSSGSMSDNDPEALGRRAAGSAFFDELGEGDRIAVMDFGAGRDMGFSSSRLLSAFTSNREQLFAALARLTEDGNTPIYRSLLDALDVLEIERPEGGGVILLVTDGAAEDDFLRETATDRAREQGVAVYSLGLGDRVDFQGLSELGVASGGGAMEAAEATSLQAGFAGIDDGLRRGFVRVIGEGAYPELPGGLQRYTLRGELLTDEGLGGPQPLVTPFQFTLRPRADNP